MRDNTSFRDIFSSHQGKYSDKWDSYLEVYDLVLTSLREKPITLLEIGVQNGGSLEIWDKYFPDAQKILGCDVNPKCSLLLYDNPKIKVIIGDAASAETKEAIKLESESLSLILDDGSHTSRDIIQTFLSLFPLLDSNGIYIVEDICCSYWLDWGGGLNSETSSISFFKSLVDVVNFQHWGLDGLRSDVLSRFGFKISPEFEQSLTHIQSVNFFNSICVITKNDRPANIGPRVGAGLLKTVDPLLGVTTDLVVPIQQPTLRNNDNPFN
jgi:hypothetical protein